MFCHHKKGGDCKNKFGSAGISLSFDDNKYFNRMNNFGTLMCVLSALTDSDSEAEDH